MENLKCIAVDDEPLALRIIEDFCRKAGFLDLAATASSAIEAAELLKHTSCDLLFMDINMPHLTGVDFVKMGGNLPMVIFTTAYSEYALTGFELNAVDYLLKPFPFDRFFKAVTKARELHEMKLASVPSIPGESDNRDQETDYIMARVEYSTVRINIPEILYVEGLKDYVKIYTDHKNYVTKSSMKNVEERLSSHGFQRIHKSFIVNLDRIRAFENNHVVIGEARIPVRSNNREEFLAFPEKNRL